MLSRAGQVKLIDFGTSWIRGREKDRVQGVPQDMAPEQMADRRIDLYNFGATRFRMFTGRSAQRGILIPDEVRFRTLVLPSAIKGSGDEDDESLPDGCVKRTNLLGRQGIDA